MHKKLAANPRRVVTTDVIASLLGKSWPQAVTSVNIMSEFRKSGVCPLHPEQITDSQTAPSKAVCASEESSRSENSSVSSPCGSTSIHASGTQERLSEHAMRKGVMYTMLSTLLGFYVNILSPSHLASTHQRLLYMPAALLLHVGSEFRVQASMPANFYGVIT